ncbi:MAG: hypothetical protein E7380_04320 [Clostridiales bacterium]|nr:hypothetical protein [Clostridiales bacterium]
MKGLKKGLIAICALTFGLCCFAACGEAENTNSDGSSIVEETSITVSFDPCAGDYDELETTNPLQQKDLEVGDLVKEPSIRAKKNPNNYQLEGWYTSKAYTQKWDFNTDTVSKSMTLYARWVIGYDVKYYLTDGSEAVLKRENSVAEGGYAERADKIADGYELLGYYADEACETEFDFTQPITSDTEIYLKRSEYIYFDAATIASRFYGVAGGAGEQGGYFGGINYVDDGDGGYVDVDFGYSPAGMDPHIMLENLHVDITRTQKIQVTFKNPYDYVIGENRGAHLVLYWSSMYEDDTYAFSQGAFSGMEVAHTMSPLEYSAEGDWITATFDLSSKIYNGTYVWANSAKLGLLRLQYQYDRTSADQSEAYHLHIKEIKGVTDLADREAKQAKDSFAEDFLQSDSQEDLDGVTRSNITGFDFPADKSSYKSGLMCDHTGLEQYVDVYNKTEGLLVYMPFRAQYNQVDLKPIDQTIVLEEYSSIKLTVQNYGWIPYLEFILMTEDGGEYMLQAQLPATMKAAETITIPLDRYGITGTLKTLRIAANSNGVDNAYLLKSFEFCKFDADLVRPVTGLNFLTEGEVESYIASSGVSFTSEAYAAKAVVETSNAFVEKAFNNFALHAYDTMTLRYTLPEDSSVEQIKLVLDCNGVATEHVFALSKENPAPVEVKLPTQLTNLTGVKIYFVGTGTVYLHSIAFHGLNGNGVDLSNKEVAESYFAVDGWVSGSYLESLSAMQLNTSTKNQMFYLADNNLKNLEVVDGGKLYIVYQNRTSCATAVISTYGAQSAEESINYGANKDVWIEIKVNMTEGEWAVLEIDLSDYAYDYISCVKFNGIQGSTNDIYVRAIVVK